MNLQKSKRLNDIRWLLMICIGILIWPIYATADFNRFNNFSFDDCDPFQARARIMDLDGSKAQLVAAEQTIYIVDWQLGDQQLTTELTGANGKPIDFSSLREGQWVLIKGFKHIDGGVVASLVQRIRPPERQIPVVRKISKESRRYKRIKRRLEIKNN